MEASLTARATSLLPPSRFAQFLIHKARYAFDIGVDH